MTAKRVGMSPHCVVEGAHDMHFAPCAVLGDGFIFSDLCTGTPKAWVTKVGRRYEITDVVHMVDLNLVQFRYVEHPFIDYAPPSDVTVGVSV